MFIIIHQKLVQVCHIFHENLLQRYFYHIQKFLQIWHHHHENFFKDVFTIIGNIMVIMVIIVFTNQVSGELEVADRGRSGCEFVGFTLDSKTYERRWNLEARPLSLVQCRVTMEIRSKLPQLENRWFRWQDLKHSTQCNAGGKKGFNFIFTMDLYVFELSEFVHF